MIRPCGWALVSALALSACASPVQSQQRLDPRVSVAPDVMLSVSKPNVSKQNGLMRVTLALHNTTGYDVPVLVETDWFDAQNRPIPTVMSLPERLTVPRYGDAVVDSLAPRPAAFGFHIRLESDTQ